MLPNHEKRVASLRAFIYRITRDDARSPVSEAEIEEIARCALAGGYKNDVQMFAATFGRWVLDLPVEN